MSRTDILQARMVATMPLPEPTAGVRFGRVRLFAASVGENPIAVVSGVSVKGHEPQMGDALEMLLEGAVLERCDANPTVWDEEHSALWWFRAVADDGAGAKGLFLDQWGRILQTPRYQSETDTPYSKRILLEVISPSTTNKGLAALIDLLLGVTGTQVLEAEDFLNVVRLNDGHRMNNGVRFMAFGAWGAESFWNTFVVILPSAIPAGHTEDEIEALIDRRRAAGTRLLTILVGTGELPPPEPEPVTPVITASITEGPAGDKEAGVTPYSASVPVQPAVRYTWEVQNGYLLAGQGTRTIQFGLGEAMEDCILVCTVQDLLTGVEKDGTLHIPVLPYPRTATITTAVLSVGAQELGSVTMAERFTINEVTANGTTRLRLYETADQRYADRNRPIGTNPSGDHGLLLEVITDTEHLDLVLKPRAEGANGDTPQTKTIYYTATNIGAEAKSLIFGIDFIQEVNP